jgi:hypothetical protein
MARSSNFSPEYRATRRRWTRAALPRQSCTGASPRRATHRSHRSLPPKRQRLRSRRSGEAGEARDAGVVAERWRGRRRRGRRRTRARGCRARRSWRKGSGKRRRSSPRGAAAPPLLAPASAALPLRPLGFLAGTLAPRRGSAWSSVLL